MNPKPNDLMVKALFTKHPSVEYYYGIVLNKKGEEAADQYLIDCIERYMKNV